MGGNLHAARAEALFASPLQASQRPAPAQVRRAITVMLARCGVEDCAARVAGEFGDHPEAAADRMSWALRMVNTAYGAPVTGRPRQLVPAG